MQQKWTKRVNHKRTEFSKSVRVLSDFKKREEFELLREEARKSNEKRRSTKRLHCDAEECRHEIGNPPVKMLDVYSARSADNLNLSFLSFSLSLAA